jgi:Acetyltransferase (GNAT) family
MWQRIVSPFQEFGWAAGLLYVLDRLVRAISPGLGIFVYELMVQPITGKPLLPANLAKNLTFVEIHRNHADLALMPALPDIKASRFDQGAVCLGIYRRDILIGYVWFCFRRYLEDEVRCTYELTDPEHSVFDFDLYVMPEHRMGIGFMAIWHCANAYLHQRGVRYTFSRLTRFNLASRRSHAHLGWKCAARAVFVRAWRLELMLASAAPYVALTWTPTSRTRLRLSPEVLALSALQPRAESTVHRST